MKEVHLPLLTATFAALEGNILFNENEVPIYDRVPLNANKPYVRIVQIVSTDATDSKCGYTHNVLQQIDIVTEFKGSAGGKEDCAVIAGQILPILIPNSPSDYLNLSESDLNIYIVRLDLDTSFEEKIGNDTIQITRVLQVRYLIEEL